MCSPRRLVLSLLIVLSVGGCGGQKGPRLGQVSGRVTLYGRPVVAELLFQPLDPAGKPGGRPSMALSDKSGLYQARFTEDSVGAVPGKHRITVTVFPFADEGEPATYEDATRPLRRVSFERTVGDDRNQFDFLLTL